MFSPSSALFKPLRRLIASAFLLILFSVSLQAQTTAPGLKAEYFNNTSLTASAVFTRTESLIFNVWGAESPGAGIGEAFSARWTGKIKPPTSESYTFYADVDDNVRVWIGGTLVLDNWASPANVYEDLEGTPITLTANQLYDLKVEYRNTIGGAMMTLKWQTPTRPRDIIGSAFYFQSATTVDTVPPTAAFAAYIGTLASNYFNSGPAPGGTTSKSPFNIQLDASESLSGLEATDFIVTNCSITYVSQQTAGVPAVAVPKYTIGVLPTAAGSVTVTLPAGRATDLAGNALGAVGPTSYTYAPTTGGPGLQTEYFNNRTLTGTPAVTRTEGLIFSYWGGNNSPAAGVNGNNFSVRWTGQLKAPTSESYRFFADFNSNFRLWVDGQLLIDSWDQTDVSRSDVEGLPIQLTAGRLYSIKAEFNDAAGDAFATLKWQTNSRPRDIIGAANYFLPGTITPRASGLTAKYYNGETLTTLVTERIDPNVNFYWGEGSPVAGVPADHFSVAWTGCVVAPVSENYTFYLTADDGARLWINNHLVIDRWNGPITGESASAAVSLIAGQATPIRVEYREAVLTAAIELRWSSASTAKAIIPQARFLVNESSSTDGSEVLGNDDPLSITSAIPAAYVAAVEAIDTVGKTLKLTQAENSAQELFFDVPAGTAAYYLLEESDDLQSWLPATNTSRLTSLSATEQRIRFTPSAASLRAFFRLSANR